MLEVYFHSDKEVISFCEYLFRYNKQIELHWKADEDWGNQLQLEHKNTGKESVEVIAKVMKDVFLIHRFTAMIEQILKDYYYYTNADEIERIQELTHWIFSGDDAESVRIRKNKDPEKLLQSLFIANIKNTVSIHYDSIAQFRLKVFKDQLVHYIGLAIDEFKREEEHQAFLNTLREYIANKETSEKVVHVLQGSRFSFFKENGKAFSRSELRKLKQQEPLYIIGLDESEWNLAPLIAMAPKQINIYGDHPSEPKTLTVINVFEEKVVFKPYRQFPFANQRNSPQ